MKYASMLIVLALTLATHAQDAAKQPPASHPPAAATTPAPKPLPALTDAQKLQVMKVQVQFLQTQSQMAGLAGYAELNSRALALQQEFGKLQEALCGAGKGMLREGANGWECVATGPPAKADKP